MSVREIGIGHTCGRAAKRSGVVLLVACMAGVTAAGTSAAGAQHRLDASRMTNRDALRAAADSKVIEFDIDEGTNLTLDASAKGGWLVFDLLGHIHRVGAAGGAAEVLTQNSGLALNITPAVSPDGRRIAFASDRSGQLNLWIMNADGSAPVALTNDEHARYVDPAWAPDGRSIVAVRRSSVPRLGLFFPLTEIWWVPVDGSAPRLLVKPAQRAGSPSEQLGAPSFSPDGKYLYFHRSTASACLSWLKSSRYRLQRLELATGKISEVRHRSSAAPDDCAAERQHVADETEPRVSADGRWLAFALTSSSETLKFRGHDFMPGTALMIRDLATGRETRIGPMASALTFTIQQRLEINPASISWSPDSSKVFYAADGRIHVADVAGRESRVIPFQAHVRRAVSKQLESRRSVDTGDSFAPALLQWPSTSPDGRSLIYIAAGQLWLAQRAGSTSRLIDTARIGKHAALYTPAWSPSGEEIAFTSWDPEAGGHVWRYTLRSGALHRVTQQAGRYLYPAWNTQADALAYLHNAEPLRLTPQMFLSPFSDGAWHIVMQGTGGQERKLAQTQRPHAISFGLDGRLRYLTQVRDAQSGDVLSLKSLGPGTGEQRDELQITPVPWYWPETTLAPDGDWVLLALGKRAFACSMTELAKRHKRFNIETAAAFDSCQRLDIGGAWFTRWRDAATIEYADGSSQVSVDVARGVRTVWPVVTSLQRPRSRDLLLRNATLIPLDGKAVTRRGDVLIVNRRIACIGACAATAAAEVVDLAGKFIIPGIIDTHDHTTRVPNEIPYPDEWKSRASLAYGVTTRYDPFTRDEIIVPLADAIEAGRMLGPRTFGSGDVINVTNPAGGPMLHFDYEWPLSNAEEARFEASRRARLGVPILKHYWVPSRAQGQLVAAAARAENLRVTSEGLSMHQSLSWVMDGQMFEHNFAGQPLYGDATKFLGLSGAVYTPTLVAEAANHFRSNPELFADFEYASFASEEIVQGYVTTSRMSPGVQWRELTVDIQAEAAKDITRHGGRVSVGSHGEIPGLASHLEIWLLSAAMGPHEALRAAALNGAYKLGMQADLGSIETGKVADLLVLDANPLDDIKNTARISHVVKSGTLYPRAALESSR